MASSMSNLKIIFLAVFSRNVLFQAKKKWMYFAGELHLQKKKKKEKINELQWYWSLKCFW